MAQYKWSNICTSDPKKEETECAAEKNIFRKIVTESLPSLAETPVQEAERTSNKIDEKKFMPRNILITLLKVKDKEKKS